MDPLMQDLPPRSGSAASVRHLRRPSIREDPKEEQETQDAEAIPPSEDPWSLVRIAMGSLAGESWRVKQALQRPAEAWNLREPAEGSSVWEYYNRTQTFDDFRRAIPFRPNTTNGTIEIIFVGDMLPLQEQLRMDFLLLHLQVFLGLKISLRPRAIEFGEWAHIQESSDGQPQAGAHYVLAQLKEVSDCRSICTVGITESDLYPPKDYEFVTGIVDTHRRISLVSIARYLLNLQSKGIQIDMKDALSPCIVMVVCREVLKLCGLRDCHLMHCLMNPFPGGGPEEVRLLPFNLCCICLRKLQFATQSDLLDRYSQLPPVLADWFIEESQWAWQRMQQVGLPTYASLK